MAEELPESLARTESVLQPGAVIQLQSDADLRDSETESRRGGGRYSRPEPPSAHSVCCCASSFVTRPEKTNTLHFVNFSALMDTTFLHISPFLIIMSLKRDSSLSPK